MKRPFGILHYLGLTEWGIIPAIKKSDYTEFYVLEIKSQVKKGCCQKNICCHKVRKTIQDF